ncbi:hypothetical protein QWZ14_01585 [Paeniroseomonas aquatica]|uniref:Uncharacterized protein n=1 Tax=Paeniroseomonas aquatica TaxID=373043 RepID=A0ABT8A0K5_9PROT|nr:hypothetical protein [Paeniroseomonas aquatica]MDN3563069.1 hypothetical protein [Paeniroseomonas aquatica]
MPVSNALLGAVIAAGISAMAPPAIADGFADRDLILAQATGQQEQRPQGPHFDPTQGGGQQPHNPNAAPTQSGGPPAHFDSTQGDGQQPHRPDTAPGRASSGPGAHFDSTQGGGQQPHTPGRGAPQPGR